MNRPWWAAVPSVEDVDVFNESFWRMVKGDRRPIKVDSFDVALGVAAGGGLPLTWVISVAVHNDGWVDLALLGAKADRMAVRRAYELISERTDR